VIGRRAQTLFTRAHTWVYRRTGGRIGGSLRWPSRMEQVLLTTTGRRTGRRHTTPLTGIPHGDELLLIASDGGSPDHPQWYRNLLADDRVVVQRGPTEIPMRARTATAAERAELWPRVVGVYPGYARYQARTERQIPLVICRRTTL
jgi:deazaflavin-dependent oxidoreductase (nitroreductase family)